MFVKGNSTVNVIRYIDFFSMFYHKKYKKENDTRRSVNTCRLEISTKISRWESSWLVEQWVLSWRLSLNATISEM